MISPRVRGLGLGPNEDSKNTENLVVLGMIFRLKKKCDA